MNDERRSPLPPARGRPGTTDDEIKQRDLRRLGEEGGAVGLRVGRDPANLGDEVPAEADLTVPEPVGQPAEM